MKIYFLKTLLILTISFYSYFLSAQNINTFYQSLVDNVSYDSIQSYLTKLQSLGIKTSPSPEQKNTLSWLINKYQLMGYSDIQRDTFLNSGDTLVNIIITKTGTKYPQKYLIIDGHYDTTVGTGVNDNGSGISIILEIARLLKDIDTEFSIRFINFSGEELGLLGSYHYVSSIVTPQNMDILLVLNIDEVGGVNGMINNTVVCEKDMAYPSGNNAVSSAYTDTLVNLVHLYSSLQTEIKNAYGSDYVPFQQAGKIITGLFEKNQSPYIHSINDSLSNLDKNYVFEIAKASTGAALYFSKAMNTLQQNDDLKKNDNPIQIYLNPFNNEITICGSMLGINCILTLFDSTGKQIYLCEFNKESISFKLPYTTCFYRICNTKNNTILKSGILSVY